MHAIALAADSVPDLALLLAPLKLNHRARRRGRNLALADSELVLAAADLFPHELFAQRVAALIDVSEAAPSRPAAACRRLVSRCR
jgi:hypothetical protein